LSARAFSYSMGMDRAETTTMAEHSNRLPDALARAASFALIWWALTADGPAGSWLVGGPVVALATLASLALLPHQPLSLPGLLRFLPFFVWHSLRGGIDVARCALHPRRVVDPVELSHRWRLPPGPSRLVVANVASLIPGTLTVDLDDAALHMHVLDAATDARGELDALERRVADLFAIELAPDGEGA
jgi:multicomponent Na+:H+ antiporter subunit E